MKEDQPWKKCTSCNELVHTLELQKNLFTCPYCEKYFQVGSAQRIALSTDEGSFFELFEDIESKDILGFVDKIPYEKRLAKAKKTLKKKCAVTCGTATVKGQKVVIAAMDFAFMGGSLGKAEGEKIALITEYASEHNLPLVIFSSSGGARIQESMHSLMQMAKTTSVIKQFQNKGGFFLSILTHPTMGGVSASFAFLGDIILAEKDALIGFTGPRVIEQVTGVKLSKGDQRAEFQLKAGMIDQVIKRENITEKIAFYITMCRQKI